MLDPGKFDPQELQAILDDIVADDRRAGDVIRRVRALIRRDEAELQPVRVNDLVADVLDLAHSDLIERGVSVTTGLGRDIPEIMADRIQLQQVGAEPDRQRVRCDERNPGLGPSPHHYHGRRGRRPAPRGG
jgi:C4-dicarboxylate-specific signal transduction histidine kinase